MVTFFTFLPSFIFILLGGPLVESTHGDLKFTAPLTGITAAVVGVILNLAVFFALPRAVAAGLRRSLRMAVGACSALAAAIALFRFKRGVIPVIATAAVLGLLWSLARPFF